MPDYLVIGFLAVLGACIGSFLNVVIYRLPKGLSIIYPASHCPACKNKIRWFDNIPVISYLALRCKCRYCRTPISPRYALIELVTAVTFIALYDAFYKSNMHCWFGDLTYDWPIFASHLILLAVLVACSAIDIEYYLIDIRITYLALAVGLISWSILPWQRLSQITAWSGNNVAVFAGLIGALAGLILRYFLLPKLKEIPEQQQEESDEPPKNNSAKPSRLAVFLIIVYAVGALILIIRSIIGKPQLDEYKIRGWAYLIWAFLAIIAGSIPKRQSDDQIVDIIEQEKTTSRSVAITELLYLLPVISGFLLAYLVVRLNPSCRQVCEQTLNWRLGPLMPLMGLNFALTGIFAAAAFGWIIRIVFTLVFGKEAMGVGDIYILSAIGKIAGPAVAIIGFFIGSVIGVFGIVVLLLWKTSRALSYGPWIAIGAFVSLLFYNPIVNYLKPAAKVLVSLCSDS